MSMQREKALNIFRENNGILRTGEALKSGIFPKTLYAMKKEGIIETMARGVHCLAGSADFPDPDLVLVSKKVARGIICLVSALSFYNLTTQIPHFVYVSIPINSRKPKVGYPPTRFFWSSKKLHMEGVQEVISGGCKINIYNPEKTLADCLKYRNKIGLEIVIEALTIYWRREDVNLEKLEKYVKLNRVEKVYHPIMSTIVRSP